MEDNDNRAMYAPPYETKKERILRELRETRDRQLRRLEEESKSA